jgi:hypothetical protein
LRVALHRLGAQELAYLLVCCSADKGRADKGRRALSPTGTHTHTGLMAGAAPYYLSDFLTGTWVYYFLLRPL